jgi:fumarate hydratase subunit beta
MIQAIEKEEELPFDIKGQTIYSWDPPPPSPVSYRFRRPTTSGRMDDIPPKLCQRLRAIKRQGNRCPREIEALKKYNAVY